MRHVTRRLCFCHLSRHRFTRLRAALISPKPIRRYEMRGIVRAVPSDYKTIEIEQESIPGFMPSMTMHAFLRSFPC